MRAALEAGARPRRRPLVAVLGQQSGDQPRQVWVQVGTKRFDRLWIRLCHGDQCGRQVAALERRLAGGHLVQHASQAEQVAAKVHFLPLRLFGGHVAGRPQHDTALRQPGVVRGGASELELYALELGDRFPELFPLLRVLHGVFERAGGQAEHMRTDADAPLVQRLDGDLVALAGLAEDAVSRGGAVLEDQLACATGSNAQLVFLLADCETGGAAFDQERRYSSITRLGIDVRKDDEEVGLVAVGDPELTAVHDVVAAARGTACCQREGIAP